MKGFIRNTIIIFIAFLFIAVGLLGLVLPLLPGILFVLVGALILSAYNPRFEEWLHSITRKYPPLHVAALDLQKFIERILGKKHDDSR